MANDNRLIAGFWTDIDTRGVLNQTGNKVYYQISQFLTKQEIICEVSFLK
jgi:hypothetical protein